MTWPPHQMTWHASKQVTSPPWNSRRLVHGKEMVWASRWSVALSTFYRQILSLLYSSFFFWNFRPRLARELLVYISNMINLSFWNLTGKSLPYSCADTDYLSFATRPWGCYFHPVQKRLRGDAPHVYCLSDEIPMFYEKNPRLYLVYLCASSCISGIVSPKHITSNIDKTLTDTQLLDCILCRNLSQLSELNHKPMRRTRPLTGQQLQLLDSSVNVGRHVVNKFEKCIKLRRIFAWDKLCGILSIFFCIFLLRIFCICFWCFFRPIWHCICLWIFFSRAIPWARFFWIRFFHICHEFWRGRFELTTAKALHFQKCFKDFLNSESRVEWFISFGLRKAH